MGNAASNVNYTALQSRWQSIMQRVDCLIHRSIDLSRVEFRKCGRACLCRTLFLWLWRVACFVLTSREGVIIAGSQDFVSLLLIKGLLSLCLTPSEAKFIAFKPLKFVVWTLFGDKIIIIVYLSVSLTEFYPHLRCTISCGGVFETHHIKLNTYSPVYK